MKNLVTLNFKYIMEGREDDRLFDMLDFIENLISVAKTKIKENPQFSSPEAYENYDKALVNGYPNGRYMEPLIDEVAAEFLYFNEDGGEEYKKVFEEEIRRRLRQRIEDAYLKAKNIFEKVEKELDREFGDD